MDWAQNEFPQYFPSQRQNQAYGPYIYRHYPENDFYLGVDDQSNVVVIGPFGRDMVTVGTLASFTCRVFPEQCRQNTRPTAHIRVTQPDGIGELARLDGTASADVDADPLSYRWKMTQRPAGSAAALTDENGAKQIFVPDVPGSYTLELVVSDGLAESAAAAASVIVLPRDPAAPVMTAIRIVGPRIVPSGPFSPAETYAAVVSYSDGSERVANPASWTRTINTDARSSIGTFFGINLGGFTAMSLTARVDSPGATLSDTIWITTSSAPILRPAPTRMDLVGPATIPQERFQPLETYIGVLAYPDGSNRVANPISWTMSNRAGWTQSGPSVLLGGDITVGPVVLAGTYSGSSGTLSVSKAVDTTAIGSNTTPRAAAISGPAYVRRGAVALQPYTLDAVLSDGYQRIGASPVTWSIAKDGGPLQEQDSGNFVIGQVDFDTLQLTARYALNGITATTSRTIRATAIEDPYFQQQTSLFGPDSAEGGINIEGAWKVTAGDPNLVVGVVDTGVLHHSDLGGRLLPGYNFVEGTSDSRDPGGVPPAGCFVPWHGTGTAGIIAANSNSTGIAGINRQSRLLPVRAVPSFMGNCSGPAQDPNIVAKAIRWASGLPVEGAPVNTNPARVINVSLLGASACTGAAMQSAISAAAANGTTVVIAAGNQGQDSSAYGLCAEAIWVSAIDSSGARASFTNTGAGITLAAPGVDGIFTTSDGGTTAPLNNNAIRNFSGTSAAAPFVTGVVSLMLSANPSLTPAQIRSILTQTVRAFPTDVGAACTPSKCGAGVLDATAAVRAAAAVRTASVASNPQ